MPSNARRRSRRRRRGCRARRAGPGTLSGSLLRWLLTLGAGSCLTGPEVVAQVVGGENLVADVEVPLVPDLLVEPPDQRLVLRRGHRANLVAPPGGVKARKAPGVGRARRAVARSSRAAVEQPPVERPHAYRSGQLSSRTSRSLRANASGWPAYPNSPPRKPPWWLGNTVAC